MNQLLKWISVIIFLLIITICGSLWIAYTTSKEIVEDELVSIGLSKEVQFEKIFGRNPPRIIFTIPSNDFDIDQAVFDIDNRSVTYLMYSPMTKGIIGISIDEVVLWSGRHNEFLENRKSRNP